MTEYVEIFSDRAVLIERAYDLVVAALQTAINDRGRATIALAGGSTPKPLYEKLVIADLAWDKLFVFWGDERYVPVTHPDSNAGMAKQAWLDQVAIPPQQIFVTPTAATPLVDAQTYAAQIQACFGLNAGEFPQFDVILLGMGADGHTASLFPHTPALNDREAIVTVGCKDNDPRITFTFPTLFQARSVLFLISGADKQTALSHVFASSGDEAYENHEDQQYPSRQLRSRVQPAANHSGEPSDRGDLYWLLDRAAVGDLELS